MTVHELVLPYYRADGYPAEEEDQINATVRALVALRNQVDRFSSAVRLLEYVRTLPMTSPHQDWAHFAAGGAVVTVFEIAVANGRIREAASKAPTLWSETDQTKLREAGAIFAGTFPNYAGHRNAVAHPVEHYLDVARHGLRKAGLFMGGLIRSEAQAERGLIVVGEALIGDVYYSTRDGKEVATEVSRATEAALKQMLENTFAAFIPSNEAAKKRALAAHLARRQPG